MGEGNKMGKEKGGVSLDININIVDEIRSIH